MHDALFKSAAFLRASLNGEDDHGRVLHSGWCSGLLQGVSESRIEPTPMSLRIGMTHDDIVRELDFISRRAAWLSTQPMQNNGMLNALDMRLEAQMLRRRVEELEREYHAL